MEEYEVVANEGIGPVRLGATLAEVQEHLGQGTSEENITYWCDNALRVEFDESGRVEFIEVSRGGPIKPTLSGRDIFSTPASELVLHLQQLAAYDRDDPELGNSYWFPKLQIALWRPSVPEEGALDDPGQCFATVAVAAADYYA